MNKPQPIIIKYYSMNAVLDYIEKKYNLDYRNVNGLRNQDFVAWFVIYYLNAYQGDNVTIDNSILKEDIDDWVKPILTYILDEFGQEEKQEVTLKILS